MREFTRSRTSAPTFPIIELINELTVGQRQTETVELLSTFLHRAIFPKLAPFITEIYYPDPRSSSFLPSCQLEAPDKKIELVPKEIQGDSAPLEELKKSRCPVAIHHKSGSSTDFSATDTGSRLLVPIFDGSLLTGILYLGSTTPCSFSPDFLQAIVTLAAVIGSRLKSMGVIRRLKQSMQDLEYSDRLRTTLYEISAQAHRSEDMDDLYAKLHRKVGRLLHAQNFFIALVEQCGESRSIKFPYYVDRNDHHFQGMELALDRQNCSITGYLLKTRQPLLLTPTSFDRMCEEHHITCVGSRPYSWLGAPFFVGGVTGAVAVQSYREIIYTEKDKELMAFVARHIGEALNRKRSVDQLKKAKESAEQAEKNKSIFLANMSHEIRTPMNGILGLTDLVLHSDISGQKRSYLEMIHSSADRLLKLINDILDFSKIEAGKLELDVAPFSLRATISGALEILAITAAKKNIGLTVDCPEGIPDMLLGDGGKLSQILINLVGNGVKFTTEGSVTVFVREEQRRETKERGVALQFEIRDTGIGIPEAQTKKIFQAFNQVGSSQRSGQRGTGLGLVIAGELVEMMGGKICVDSTPGVGTVFYFTVDFTPVKAAETSQNEVHQSPGLRLHRSPGLCGENLRILLVEDDYINQILTMTLLEREGWKVAVAENGAEAINRLKEESCDLILMDIQMPELDGFETTRVIRRMEKDSGHHIPIIAMTAYAVKGDREKCLAAGMDGYISKPIRPDKLGREIETALCCSLPGQVKPQTP